MLVVNLAKVVLSIAKENLEAVLVVRWEGDTWLPRLSIRAQSAESSIGG